MSETYPWEQYPLHELEARGIATLGRGNIISKKDIQSNPGGYPIYSSSAKGEGLFGNYGDYMFDEEMITWSVDGGGNLFYRQRHRFSVTNVSGYMRLDTSVLDYRFSHAVLALQHSKLTFDYQTKAHPSVIRNLYHLPIPPLPEQKKIAEILSGVDKRREATTKKAANILRLQNALREKIFSSLHGERVPLGEICNPKQWQTISTTQLTDSGYPVYGANGMIGYFSEFNHKDPVLAVTCRGATCGNLTLVPGFSYVTGNSMCLDNPRSDTSPEYLFHFLSWRGLKDVISGSAQPQITRSPLQAVEVVLPSVEKQDKIVSALESVSNMEHSVKTMLNRLDLLKQALATDLLSGRKRVSV